MKTLLFILSILFSYQSMAQVSSYTVIADSLMGCTTNIGFSIQGGTLDDNATITFDWGDGTIDNENIFVAAGTYEYVSLSHSYTNSGTYISETQVYSSVLSANVDSGEQIPLTVNGATTCGFIYLNIFQSPTTYYNNVPLDFTDNLGVTTTITPVNYGLYEGLNPANAPYDISVNSNWLTNHSLDQISANPVISGFNGPSGSAQATTNQIEVDCNGTIAQPDFDISFAYVSNFVAPLQTGTLLLKMCNISCSNSANATVSMIMPTGFIPTTTGLTNPIINGNTLSFDLISFSECETLNIPFTFPGTIPAGTEICFDIDIDSANDLDVTNNTQTACGNVLNSYDPNDKQVNLPTQIDPLIKEKLTYKIQFQNDGNYNAVNVKVTDIIDANLDLATFKVLGSKHGIGTTVNTSTREVIFTFANAQLTPSGENLEGSQGYVIYSIEENDNLPEGTEIENTASIYFDFNSAIVTNTTYNINETILGLDHLSSMNYSMYPNPAKSFIQFEGINPLRVDVYNLAGELVQSELNLVNNSIDISKLANGFYQLILTTEDGLSTNKLSIQH